MLALLALVLVWFYVVGDVVVYGVVYGVVVVFVCVGFGIVVL